MGISLFDQLRLIKDVIDSEHGGKVYDGYHYITPDWDLIGAYLDGSAMRRSQINFEIILENT